MSLVSVFPQPGWPRGSHLRYRVKAVNRDGSLVLWGPLIALPGEPGLFVDHGKARYRNLDPDQIRSRHTPQLGSSCT